MRGRDESIWRPRRCIGERERERADRERRLAERQQRGAEIERERLGALLSGDQRAYLRARNLRMPALPDGSGAGIDEVWTSVLHRAEQRHLIVAEREDVAAERELAADDSETSGSLRSAVAAPPSRSRCGGCLRWLVERLDDDRWKLAREIVSV
jgi:hypothetical protein